MDTNEVYMLFKVFESALAHGTMFTKIRDEALAQLKKIEAETKAQPLPVAEPVAVPVAEGEKEPEDA